MVFLNYLLYTLLGVTSLFLICLVLIQRGKGGGLAGAFGGAGGSSAFGTKAGDVFTRVTMISAGIWIALNMLLVVMSNRRTSAYESPNAPAAKSTFTPSKSADGKPITLPGTAKTSGPVESVEKGSGTPVAPKAVPTNPSPLDVSGGSPAAPLPLPPSPPVTPRP